MPFKPGDPRPKNAGRKPGTPNRATRDLEEQLRNHNIFPIEQLAAVLPELDPPKRADIFMRLLAFLYPTKKSVEVQSDAGEANDERVNLLYEELKMLKGERK